MRQRLISAAVLVPVVVIVFLLGDPEHGVWLIGGVALLAAAAAFETSRLLRGAGLLAEAWFAVAAAAIAVVGQPYVFGIGAAGGLRTVMPAVYVAVVAALTALIGVARRDPADGFRVWIGTTFAAFYAGLLAFIYGIVELAPGNGALAPGAPLFGVFDAGRTWLLILVLTVWSLDSAAYVVGRTYQRGRFMSHISPNKTWSGAIGGTLIGIVVATVLVWATGNGALLGIVVGVVVTIAAQAGDLAESMLKRAAGAKDSGALIPGHGGVLDRVDSLMFAAPALFALLVVQGAVNS